MENTISVSLDALLTVMKQLRDKRTGCEWDRIQTFNSLIPFLLEEAYEVQDAVLRYDHRDLKQELGDLLYHIIFYADIAEEYQLFDFHDVCKSLTQKLIQRHPQIFSTENTFPEIKNWEIQKQKERDAKCFFSLLDDLPKTFPALMRSEKIQKRCASVGFDWDAPQTILDKVKERLCEVQGELEKTPREMDALQEGLGDLLFSIVSLVRHLGYNTEQILHRANEKFERRFRELEKQLVYRNMAWTEIGTREMEHIRQHIKRNEKSKER